MADAPTPHPTVLERVEAGRAARAKVPRQVHAELEPDAARDPVGLLEAEGAARVPELLPIRYGRMLRSPFAFFRGAAAVMANDLAPLPRTGLRVQLCGDAHLLNSAASRRRSAISSSTSTISTRRCPDRSNGT